MKIKKKLERNSKENVEKLQRLRNYWNEKKRKIQLQKENARLRSKEKREEKRMKLIQEMSKNSKVSVIFFLIQ